MAASPIVRNDEQSPSGVCLSCGSRVNALVSGDGAERCDACLDAELRTLDAGFLDNYARFGARSRQVVAEACLRALVLSDLSDRKILGNTVYEQFIQAATDLINLYYAIQARDERSIAHSFLSFNLDQVRCINFFADVIEFSAVDIFERLGLVHPDRVPLLYPEMTKKERRELVKALREALADLARVADYQEIGETALMRAADQMHSSFAIADRLPVRGAGRLDGDQVASLAIDRRRGSISLNALSVDETRLGEVVDGIDVMTRLTRNIIYAYLSINVPDALRG